MGIHPFAILKPVAVFEILAYVSQAIFFKFSVVADPPKDISSKCFSRNSPDDWPRFSSVGVSPMVTEESLFSFATILSLLHTMVASYLIRNRSLKHFREEGISFGCPCTVTAVIPFSVFLILANSFAPELNSARRVLIPGLSELIVTSIETLQLFEESETEERALETGEF